jgi:peptidoglycan/LPS O-acetylase OafA/YrhL
VKLAHHFSELKALSLLKTLGKYSLPIYLAHIILTSGSRIVMVKFLHLTHWPLIFIVGSVLGLAVPIILFKLTKNTSFAFLFDFPPFLSAQAVRFRKPVFMQRIMGE